MFTGIVEEVGRIAAVEHSSPHETILVTASRVLEDLHAGDSISVNGVCLTATRLATNCFAAGVMAETTRRSNLGDLAPGDTVNLERPLLPSTRLGGHFVQGHVDAVGTVESVALDGTALAVRISAPPQLLRYVVEKGFIAIDGASLTVTQVDERGFGVALIPYSQEHLASSIRTPGRRVNLEVDVLAKYLEKLVVN